MKGNGMESDEAAPAAHPQLRELYKRYGCCMAYVAVERDGDENIGGAFHVGDGVFVTARHVVDGAKIREMRLTNVDLYYRSELFPKQEDGSFIIKSDTPRICTDFDGRLEVIEGPWFHPNDAIDVAVLRVRGMEPNAHYIPLGSNLDDWVGNGDFELSEVLVLGYPPIPFTRRPALIAAASYVNAVVDLDLGGNWQMHFLLSGVPRGGFSGGVALSHWGFALGVVTQSLLNQVGPPELGYFAATSVEVVWQTLALSGTLPEVQKDGWDGFWDEVRSRAAHPSS